MTVIKILAGLILTLVVVIGAALVLTRPESLPIGNESASRL